MNFINFTKLYQMKLMTIAPMFQNDIYDWLKMLGLEQYYNTLANQGYDDIDSLTDIMWEDLEEIGIQKLGQ